MKRYYAALIAVALLLPGCFKQDYSDCVDPDNFILMFDLRDAEGNSRFAENIHSIFAVVYDAGNDYVAHAKVTKNELNEFPGVGFVVEPGEYRVVCWGNVGENSRINGIKTALPLDECSLSTVSGASGCPLYYAPGKPHSDRSEPIVTRADGEDVDYSAYAVTVPPKQITTKEINFCRAHRRVDVYVKGYEFIYGEATPMIRMCNQPISYDFLLRTCPTRRSYETTCSGTTRTDENMLLASFNTPITGLTDNMTVEVVRRSDSEVLTVVDLKQYVEQNASTITDTNEIAIQIRYTESGHVEITAPDWGGKPVVPEW